MLAFFLDRKVRFFATFAGMVVLYNFNFTPVGQLWVCLCVRHILIFLLNFKVGCLVTDVQTETQSHKYSINNGLHIRNIPEDVAKKRNFLSKQMRALLQFSHKSSEKKTQKKSIWNSAFYKIVCCSKTMIAEIMNFCTTNCH